MASHAKTTINVVFGAMTFGVKGSEQARVYNLDDCKAILDVFQSHGHTEVDTARFYGGGSSETYLGNLDWQTRGLVMDTKYFPTAGRAGIPDRDAPEGGWKHNREHIRQNMENSLKALKAEHVDMWYLHGPDRTTPYKETIAAVDELYREGKLRRWGVSNFMAWEVAQICELCDANGWVRPSVYQGVYNALHRAVELELFSCLRKYNMGFYAFNPLAGGYLTDRYQREDIAKSMEEGSRFDANRFQGKMYRERYFNDKYFDALEMLRPVAKKYGLTESECALRWMMHHSLLKQEYGDAIITGASSTKHIQSNLVDLEKDVLPEEVVNVLEAAWEKVRQISWKYWN